jgi:hypothetical protein
MSMEMAISVLLRSIKDLGMSFIFLYCSISNQLSLGHSPHLKQLSKQIVLTAMTTFLKQNSRISSDLSDSIMSFGLPSTKSIQARIEEYHQSSSRQLALSSPSGESKSMTLQLLSRKLMLTMEDSFSSRSFATGLSKSISLSTSTVKHDYLSANLNKIIKIV